MKLGEIEKLSGVAAADARAKEQAYKSLVNQQRQLRKAAADLINSVGANAPAPGEDCTGGDFQLLARTERVSEARAMTFLADASALDGEIASALAVVKEAVRKREALFALAREARATKRRNTLEREENGRDALTILASAAPRDFH